MSPVPGTSKEGGKSIGHPDPKSRATPVGESAAGRKSSRSRRPDITK
jgi:hypothetical protein